MKRPITLFAAGVAAAVLVAAPMTVSAQEESIADIAAGAGDFETLQTAAGLAGLDGLLTTVLTYHVVPGTAFAADVTAATSLTTVQGEAISVDGTVLNGSVGLVATDLEACNGVVHVIDAVLLPPSITDAATEVPAEDLPATGVDNLTAAAAANPPNCLPETPRTADLGQTVRWFSGRRVGR